MTDEFAPTGGIDPAAFAADLFPETIATPEVPESGPRSVSPAGFDTPSSGVAPSAPEGSGVSQAEWDALPKSWKKEMEAEWKTASAPVRQYVHEREKQVTQGITTYKGAADSWNKVMAPFADILPQYPGADMPAILTTLAQNHLQMIKATPSERRNYITTLAKGYGVDITQAQAQAAAQQSAQPTEGFTPAQMAMLEQTLSPVINQVRQSSEFVQKQIRDAATSEVDKFFSDSKNEFANEVADDILQLIQKGQAQTLPEAYEIAILRNPTVKAKYIAGLAARATPAPSPASKLPNVKSSATPTKAPKSGSMDDTINSVIAKHYAT